MSMIYSLFIILFFCSSHRWHNQNTRIWQFWGWKENFGRHFVILSAAVSAPENHRTHTSWAIYIGFCYPPTFGLAQFGVNDEPVGNPLTAGDYKNGTLEWFHSLLNNYMEQTRRMAGSSESLITGDTYMIVIETPHVRITVLLINRCSPPNRSACAHHFLLASIWVSGGGGESIRVPDGSLRASQICSPLLQKDRCGRIAGPLRSIGRWSDLCKP